MSSTIGLEVIGMGVPAMTDDATWTRGSNTGMATVSAVWAGPTLGPAR
jgi:hypothetical protein